MLRESFFVCKGSESVSEEWLENLHQNHWSFIHFNIKSLKVFPILQNLAEEVRKIELRDWNSNLDFFKA